MGDVYKLTGWDIGDATMENGLVLPMMRARVVDVDLSVHNTKQEIDLLLPDEESVKMLRDTCNDYLKSKKTAGN